MILSGGGGCLVRRGGLLRGVPGPRGYLVPEGVPAPVGSHPRGGSAPWGGGGGAWSWGGPGGDPLGTATAVGGTHPTGMHSCYLLTSS